MSNLEDRLRALMAQRSADAVGSPAELPRATRRRALVRRILSAASALALVTTGTGLAMSLRSAGVDPVRPAPIATEPDPEESTVSASPAQPETRVTMTGGTRDASPNVTGRCIPSDDATDGVTRSRVLLGATIVKSGIGAFHLRDADAAMRGAVAAVNAAGGICGRTIELKLVDDGWDAQRGLREIRRLVEQDRVAALAVVPSTQGLAAAANIAYFSKNGIAAAGTLGTSTIEFNDPNVFPVGVSPAASGRLLARYAWQRLGARDVAVVYDRRTRSTVEQAMAFDGEIDALRRAAGLGVGGIDGYDDAATQGGCHRRACAVEPGKPSYSAESQRLYGSCATAPGCDFVGVFLDPAAASTWMGSTAEQPLPHGGTEILTTGGFPRNCGSRCGNFHWLTPFEPPVGPLRTHPAVDAYVRALQSVDRSADAMNPYTEGAYAGMAVLIEALRRVGPSPTRAAIAETLRSGEYDVGLTNPLRWRPSRSEANRSMRPLRIVITAGGFGGWRLGGERVTDR